MANKSSSIIIVPAALKPPVSIIGKAEEFVKKYGTEENKNGSLHLFLHDARSNSFYMVCHVNSDTLIKHTDLEAVLDPNESEDYKLNRDIYTDSYAYQKMASDAIGGRSFEDIVVEYDCSYRPDKPLKVFGGQHRITAVKEAGKKGVTKSHGIRVYFDLSIDQRVDIATANNTAIAVSNDLLDRIQEDLLGSDLRSWCQKVGLLEKDENFSDRRNSEGIPTVRIARTLVVNYYLGKSSKVEDLNAPVICKSGTVLDEHYIKVREKINWNDPDLITMGMEFAKLHKLQHDRVLGRKADAHLEFANKAIHPCVAAAWSFAAGLFQSDKTALKNHYELSTVAGDPLNAKALLNARLKGVDSETYRGLGSRISSEELGRMLEVFRVQATIATKRGITKELPVAAIRSYLSNVAQKEKEKAFKRL